MRIKDDTVDYEGMSDVPDGYMGGLNWEELRMIFERRYGQAGYPKEKLKAWLDDHQVYPKRADEGRRVSALDWFGMVGLLHASALWLDEAREEEHPPYADLA